jgi:DNA-binding transcriptional ArsR family regulator
MGSRKRTRKREGKGGAGRRASRAAARRARPSAPAAGLGVTRSARKGDGVLRGLQALSHPTRWRIVQALAEAGELSCGEVVARFPLRQPTISHHLKVLSEAGLVRVRRQGAHAYFRLEPAALRALGQSVAGPTRRGKRRTSKS